jgi:hypothetical protein
VKRIDLQLIKEALTELDPTLKDSAGDDAYRTALVLFSALVYGPETTILAEFTDLPNEFVEAIRLRMIQAELWTEIEVLCDHWFGEGNTIFPTSFWLDLLIAQGKVVRRWKDEQGQYRYCLAEYALGRDQAEQRVN